MYDNWGNLCRSFVDLAISLGATGCYGARPLLPARRLMHYNIQVSRTRSAHRNDVTLNFQTTLNGHFWAATRGLVPSK
jgi:hypothetical protein